jgi:hypothetical protein
MAQRENIFFAAPAAAQEIAEWLINHLSFEPIDATDHSADIALRGPALASEGLIGVSIQVNTLVDPAAAPDEIQAIDAYPIQLDLWAPGRTVAMQETEARNLFDRLVSAFPQISAILTHDLDILRHAYLVGVGTHEFPDKTTVDFPDLESWKPWVVLR